MSRARPRFLDQVIHMSRRTNMRAFRLTPTPQIKNLCAYVIAVYAKKYFLKIHACVVMSNHIHVLFTDPKGLRSEFYRDVHARIGSALNALQGIKHASLWDNRQTGEVEELDPETAWEDMLYVAENPIRAGLVDRCMKWKGFMVTPKDWGRTLKFRRPKFYFSKKNKDWPASIELKPVPPPTADERSTLELRRKAIDDLRKRCQRIRRSFKKEGFSFAGIHAVRAQPITKVPTTDDGAFQLRPQWKAQNPESVDLARQRYAWWLRVYKRAVELPRERLFPEGTERFWRGGLVDADPRRKYGHYPLARPE